MAAPVREAAMLAFFGAFLKKPFLVRKKKAEA
jgi:hypothetical protein